MQSGEKRHEESPDSVSLHPGYVAYGTGTPMARKIAFSISVIRAAESVPQGHGVGVGHAVAL
jgi:hypothetical protein